MISRTNLLSFRTTTASLMLRLAVTIWAGLSVGSWKRTLVAEDRLSPSPSAVAASEVAGRVWTLSQLQQLAEENNPTLRQAVASVNMARGLYRQAGLYPNPQVGYLRTDGDRSGASRSSGVFFGQEIVTAKKIQKAQATEAWEIEQGNWNYQSQKLRVANDVELRYWEVLAAQQSLALSQKLEQVAARGLQTTERLHEAREVPKTDVLQARIHHKTSQLTRREMQARSAAVWKQLAAVTGCPDLQTTTVVGELPGDVPERDWDECWQRLQSGSPQIQASRARAQHFQNNYRLERANAIPNLNLQVVAERDHLNQFSTVSTLLSMPLPVTNRNQGNIDRAAAEIHESVAEIDRTELALRDQLAEVFRRYETAKAQVEELGDSILPDARENLEQTIAAYRAAEVGYLHVLMAQRIYMEATMSHLDAWLELRRSTVEMDGLLLTGALNPAEVGTALQAGPSGGSRRGVLNQIQESNRSNPLPAALQTGGGP